MTIRTLHLADYDAIYALWMSCRGMGLNDVDDSREGIGRYLKRNPHTCFAAWEKDTLVGIILAGHDGRRGFLHHTAVHPIFRGRRIGTALVEAALEALKKEGITKVALVVFERNLEGNAFWEKLGFTVREDLVYRNRALVEMIRTDT